MSYWWLVIPAILVAFYVFSSTKRPTAEPGRIKPPPERLGSFLGEVVGESHYQQELDRIAGGKTRDGHELVVEARLVLQDDNPHDSQAVQVCIGADLVGYLSRADARKFRKNAAPNTRVFRCRARIVGGWKDGRSSGAYGVQLDT